MLKYNKILIFFVSLILFSFSGTLLSFAETGDNDTDDYQSYRWEIEAGVMQYHLYRDNYEVFETLIPDTGGSTSPLIGLFENNELKAFYGGLYAKFGDAYYQFFCLDDFIYMSKIGEYTNAEWYLTPDIVTEDPEFYERIRQKRGESFQFYDPSLTRYKKSEYIIKDDKVFILDNDNKRLREINSEEDNFYFEDLMIEKERILRDYEDYKSDPDNFRPGL
jgi:hypothetical protein